MKKFTSEEVQTRRHTSQYVAKNVIRVSHKERRYEKKKNNYIAALFTTAQAENYKYRRQEKKPTEYKEKPPKTTSK